MPFLMRSSPLDGSPYLRTVTGVLGQDQTCTEQPISVIVTFEYSSTALRLSDPLSTHDHRTYWIMDVIEWHKVFVIGSKFVNRHPQLYINLKIFSYFKFLRLKNIGQSMNILILALICKAIENPPNKQDYINYAIQTPI